MVGFLDLLYNAIELLPGTIYNYKELIIKRLADDGLRLQLGEVDASAGEGLEYLDKCAWFVAGGDD